MHIEGRSWRTIWLEGGGSSIGVIDQTCLPYSFRTISLKTYKDVVLAIKSMIVRGAPLIGVAGAFGLMFALMEDSSDESLANAYHEIISTRPTAVNLEWALNRVSERVKMVSGNDRVSIAREEAELILEEDVKMCNSLGENGLQIIRNILKRRDTSLTNKPINILTHCNAGWLATVDWGTCLSPIYKANRENINIHVWVDETRPRNQGARLTSFELMGEKVSHTLIVDNAGGHLMQMGKVDAVFVGADRITSSGDACNKIGTYLKALAAYDNQIPFYVFAPYSTIDWSIKNGLTQIEIEERSDEEIKYVSGFLSKFSDKVGSVQISPKGINAYNPAFDVTPAKLITNIITERGIAVPNQDGLISLYHDV